MGFTYTFFFDGFYLKWVEETPHTPVVEDSDTMTPSVHSPRPYFFIGDKERGRGNIEIGYPKRRRKWKFVI